ncbi:protein FAM241B-like [Styela clava]
MVRILANGDVVQDDDPRLQQRTNTGTRYGTINSQDSGYDEQQSAGGAGDAMPYHGGQAHYQEGPTLFDTWNQKLIDIGIPRWNIGNNTIEPLMTVMFLLVMLIFGLPGLMFLGLLYLIIRISNRNNTMPNNRGDGRPAFRRPNPGVSGRRLGGLH